MSKGRRELSVDVVIERIAYRVIIANGDPQARRWLPRLCVALEDIRHVIATCAS